MDEIEGEWMFTFDAMIKKAEVEQLSRNEVREKSIKIAARDAKDAERISMEIVEKITAACSAGDRNTLEEYVGRIEESDKVIFTNVAWMFRRRMPVYMPGIV